MIRHLLAAAAILLLGACSALHGGAEGNPQWLTAWATSQQIPEPHNALAPADQTDTTLRQIIRLSVGGDRLRVRLSNAFGTAPFHIDSVHIARSKGAGSSAIDPETDRALTFAGKEDVVIPAGADYLSDPFEFPVSAMEDLAVSMHFSAPPEGQTGHPGSRKTSFIVDGNKTAAADFDNPRTVTHWYHLAGIDVLAPPESAAIGVIGDSITDGHGATTDQNNRWTDFLAYRLQASTETRHLSVLNLGLGGNRLLLDGLGPNALARFDRDVLAPAGLRYLIVLEGVNDLGVLGQGDDAGPEDFLALADRIIAAYEQMIERAHARGVKVFGATIMPYAGSDPYNTPPKSEAARHRINDWIRNSGRFDGVIDFDLATRDPDQPDRLLPAYDIGDHLHPSPAGFEAMAAAVPLSFFEK